MKSQKDNDNDTTFHTKHSSPLLTLLLKGEIITTLIQVDRDGKATNSLGWSLFEYFSRICSLVPEVISNKYKRAQKVLTTASWGQKVQLLLSKLAV